MKNYVESLNKILLRTFKNKIDKIDINRNIFQKYNIFSKKQIEIFIFRKIFWKNLLKNL